MNVLRRLLSVLLVLGAVALLPVALAGSWLDRTVTDTDTYVATVAPLADVRRYRMQARVPGTEGSGEAAALVTTPRGWRSVRILSCTACHCL